MFLPPKRRAIVFAVASDVKDSMNHYFRGQALVALCVGILFSIGFAIIGMPLAIVLGMFIGLLNMVPYLQLISIIPTTLLCVVYSMDSNVEFWNRFMLSLTSLATANTMARRFGGTIRRKPRSRRS